MINITLYSKRLIIYYRSYIKPYNNFLKSFIILWINNLYMEKVIYFSIYQLKLEIKISIGYLYVALLRIFPFLNNNYKYIL